MSQDQEVPESKIDRIRRESHERRLRGESFPDSKETAQAKAREYIEQAEAFSERALLGDAEWVTAYATLALATLALSNATTPAPSPEYL
jgi:hypothetical protein